jgi:hypothetical protein
MSYLGQNQARTETLEQAVALDPRFAMIYGPGTDSAHRYHLITNEGCPSVDLKAAKIMRVIAEHLTCSPCFGKSLGR